MSRKLWGKTALATLVAAGLSTPALAHDAGQTSKEALKDVYAAKPHYSPYAGRNYPTRPFFGDTHLHTSYSMDAGAFGARLDPRDA